MLVCCSNAYQESVRCQLEVAYATARQVPLVPVIVASRGLHSAGGWLGRLMQEGVDLSSTIEGGLLDEAASRPAKGAEALSQLTQSHLDQMRQYRRADAPNALRLVMDAMALLLRHKPEASSQPGKLPLS